jgi:hypothetical protein
MRAKPSIIDLEIIDSSALDVDPVEESMRPWDDDDSGCPDEHQPAEECIERGKELSRRVLHPIDRPHATQDHRRIQERIEPTQPACAVIANRPNEHCARNDQARPQQVTRGAAQESRPRQ